MPACSSAPNRPPAEVLDRLIDEVAWAKTCMIIAAATPPSSVERAREMDKLRAAVIQARKIVDEVLGKAQALPRDVLIALRSCELAIPKLEAGAILRQTAAGGTP
jgi:hypothetical protein